MGPGWVAPARAGEGIAARCPGTLPGTKSGEVSSPKSPSCIFLPLLKSTAEGSLLQRSQIILLIIFTGVFLTQIYDNETLWNRNIHCTAFQGNNSRYQLYLYGLSLQHILCSG